MTDNNNDFRESPAESPAEPIAASGTPEAAVHEEAPRETPVQPSADFPGPGGYYQPQSGNWQAPGWQAPPQPPAGSQLPPSHGGGSPQGAPPAQSQWVFHDYGPAGQPAPRREKPPKKVKPPRQPGGAKDSLRGFKALAVVMSILFVLSAAGFGTYVAYDLNRDRSPAAGQIPSGGGDTPSMEIQPPPQTDQPSGGNAEGVLTGNQIHEAVAPAVVGVLAYAKTPIGTQLAGQGSGVVITQDGYVVTNNHVVSESVGTNLAYSKVEVVFSDGKRYTAQVIGKDKDSDLAVLKVEATGLKTAVFGDSDSVKVGDRAFVIGNPSGLEFAGSFTGGYISAVNRYVGVLNIDSKVEFIQTDAAINPGNSGGALVNEYGQVIGIPSAKIAEQDYEGMGFAIPINNAKPIIESLTQYGWVRGRVQIGISYVPMNKVDAELNGIPYGLRVAAIGKDSDASGKGLKVGDVIYEMDGKEVHDAVGIAAAFEGKKPGDSVELSVFRVGSDDRAERFKISVILIEKKPDTSTDVE